MAVACASCGAEQASGARFCSSCGAPLRRSCPACGAEVVVGAAFCPACGASLREGASSAVAVDDHEERRVVTVLFVDLAGSTALGERIDPEELRTLQGELFGLVNAEVERFGGVSEKFVGDAVLAVFGAPLGHDDDAERAVRAALAVRDRFPAFAEDVRRRHGIDVGVRIGVNTGEVVAGREAAARGELVVSGDAVNVAARLQQHATPGTVLVGERTQSATRRAIRFEDAVTFVAKGKERPITAWEATAVTGPPGRRGVEGLSAPMIGRDDELDVLRALTVRVEREHLPQLVTLFGPAGVGKTRLVTEFVDQLPAARTLQGRCLPYGEGITFWPLAEAAKGYAGILDSDPVEVALAKLSAAVDGLVPADHARGVVEAVAWTIGLRLPESEGTDVRVRLLDAWRRFVGGLGRERLTVLVIEDVHWASEPLLDLLEQLTETLEDAAVLTVCTARTEFLEARQSWGGGARDATSIRVAPLPSDEAIRLVDALVGEGGLPEAVTGRIVARAGGDPFYVEEILQMLIDAGSIAREDGRWAVLAPLDDIDLPDSVHGVIGARLDLLDTSSREALRRCSVMGRVFWPPAVGADEAVIAGLGRRGLVSEQRESVIEGMREFAFKHALTHDVAYATLPRAERRRLHTRVGQWIEEVAPGREAETAELAAYHYNRALEYGEASRELRSRTFELLLAAGQAALARAAGSSAERLLERAVELAEGPQQRAAALLRLGRANLVSTHFDRAPEQFARARAEAELVGDRQLLAEALSWLSRASWLIGRWREALDAATEAVEVLAGLPESPQLARALARRSQIEMLRGLPEAEEHALEAITVARRVEDEHAEVNARTNLATARANRGVEPDSHEARDVVERALAIGEVEEAYRATVNFLWSAQGYLPLPQLEQALARLRGLLADVPPVEAFDVYLERSYRALVAVPAGRWDEIELDLSGADTRRVQAGSEMLRLELLGGMAMRRGDLAGAAGPLHELREIALSSGEPQRILPMAGVVLPHAALTGDLETVRVVTEAVLERTDREWAVMPTTAIPRAIAAANETALLGRVAEAFRPLRDAAPTPRLAISSAVSDGLVALAKGRAAEAVERLRFACDLEHSLGWAYRAACLELDVGTALAAAGDADGAAAAQRRAAVVLGPLGCVNPY